MKFSDSDENFITEKDLDISVSAGEWGGVVGVWLWSQQTHAVMIILLLCQNDVATSFWGNNEAIVASCMYPIRSLNAYFMNTVYFFR